MSHQNFVTLSLVQSMSPIAKIEMAIAIMEKRSPIAHALIRSYFITISTSTNPKEEPRLSHTMKGQNIGASTKKIYKQIFYFDILGSMK